MYNYPKNINLTTLDDSPEDRIKITKYVTLTLIEFNKVYTNQHRHQYDKIKFISNIKQLSEFLIYVSNNSQDKTSESSKICHMLGSLINDHIKRYNNIQTNYTILDWKDYKLIYNIKKIIDNHMYRSFENNLNNDVQTTINNCTKNIKEINVSQISIILRFYNWLNVLKQWIFSKN